jgi:hypothetical protein
MVFPKKAPTFAAQKKISLMKKFALLLSCVAFAGVANAQLGAQGILGTSYTQNFDNLGSGLPQGWHVFTEASETSLGVYWDTSVTKLYLTPSAGGAGRTNWNGTSGNFRNVASGNTTTNCLADSITQLNATDRALGLRLIGPSTTNPFGASDSSAAFAFKMTNTLSKENFDLTFKLQSLDPTSPRITTWFVDYGIGDNPTMFDTVTTSGTMTTGGNTCSNNTITVDFGSELDSLAGPVWIRIVVYTPSTGAGNRATVAIDDFQLTYTNNSTSVSSVNAANMPLTVLGDATTSNINLGYSVAEQGQYTLTITDLTGRNVYTQNVQAATGEQRTSVNANLQSGMYIIKLCNGKQTGITKAMIQ